MGLNLLYLLDTNICIYIAKHKPIEVLQRFQLLEVGQVGMSVITHGELTHGAYKSQQPQLALSKLQQLVELIPVMPIAATVSEHYGQIRSSLEKAGTPIGNNDLWIAAHALDLQVTLVTNNVREFERVPSLKLENWVN